MPVLPEGRGDAPAFLILRETIRGEGRTVWYVTRAFDAG